MKGSGLDTHLAVAGLDLTGNTASLNSIGSPRGTYVKTGLDKKAYERIYGRRDGTVSLTSYYNPAVNQSHAHWKTLPRTDRDLMVAFSGSIGGSGVAMRAKQIGYDGTRDQDGDFLLNVDAQANEFGLDHGRMLTAWPRTDATATNGAGVDFGVGSTTFGLTAYLQVLSFTGTTCTIKLQESSDNGSGDAFADVTGGAFTAVTTAGVTERIATAANLTVERYLRVVTSGTFSSISFVVLVHRPEGAPA